MKLLGKVGGARLNGRAERVLPRVYALRWDATLDATGAREEPDCLLLGVELSSDYGEPVLELELPWRRPRPNGPWSLVFWPRKRGWAEE